MPSCWLAVLLNGSEIDPHPSLFLAEHLARGYSTFQNTNGVELTWPRLSNTSHQPCSALLKWSFLKHGFDHGGYVDGKEKAYGHARNPSANQ
jgi:hypothetical protein